MALVLATYVTRYALARPATGPAAAAPVVAVAPVRVMDADRSSAWLGDGVAQLVASDLAAARTMTVVAPERVHEALPGVHPPNGTAGDVASTAGRAVGATWVVDGGLAHGDTMYVLDVSVHDVHSGTVIRLFTVTAGNLVALASRAASHLLATALPTEQGVQLSDAESADVEAYEAYVRAVQAESQGRFGDERRELDRAIALDSGFAAALRMRRGMSTGELADPVDPHLVRAGRVATVRATEWDQWANAVERATHDGEHDRAQELATEMVARFPRDPRSYATLADVYSNAGRWVDADSAFRAELALDSLGTESGRGPCVPCMAYAGLVFTRWAEGDLASAERTAARWVAWAPASPAACSALSFALSSRQRHDSSLAAARRAASLAPTDPVYAERIVRVLIAARRYASADSALEAWRASPSAELQMARYDLRALLLREQGRLRAADAVIDTAVARFPDARPLMLLRATGMAELGDYAAAAQLFEQQAHARQSGADASSGDVARAFCWTHALEADALAAAGDTIRLRALADSLAASSAASYYGRDWRLSHHVRGLIALRGGRNAEAVAELERARWGASGWPATLRALARAQLALGHPAEAVRALRGAYAVPLDAMGRYVPRSQLDLLMAVAFQRSGMADSGAVYGARVRAAWRGADPEVRRELAALGGPRGGQLTIGAEPSPNIGQAQP